MPDIKTFLKKLELNDKESNIYMALLEIGSQAASIVAKRVKIPRSSVFFHLENLIKKGFVKKDIRANIQYFSAVEPSTLERLLERKKSKIDNHIEELNQLMPNFKTLNSPFLSGSKVTYFEGVEGLCKMIDMVISTTDDIYFISAHVFHPEIKQYIRDVYVPARRRGKNKAEMILTHYDDSEDYVKYAKEIYEWIGFVKREEMNFQSTIIIYGNSIQFLSTKVEDLTGILIENPFLANTMEAVFKLLKDSRKIKQVT